MTVTSACGGSVVDCAVVEPDRDERSEPDSEGVAPLDMEVSPKPPKPSGIYTRRLKQGPRNTSILGSRESEKIAR